MADEGKVTNILVETAVTLAPAGAVFNMLVEGAVTLAPEARLVNMLVEIALVLPPMDHGIFPAERLGAHRDVQGGRLALRRGQM